MTSWGPPIPVAVAAPTTSALEDPFTAFIRKKAAKDFEEKKKALTERMRKPPPNTILDTTLTTSRIATKNEDIDLIDFDFTANNNIQVDSLQNGSGEGHQKENDPVVGHGARHSHFQIDIGNLTAFGNFIKQKDSQTNLNRKRHNESQITNTSDLSGTIQHQAKPAKIVASESSDVDKIVARTKAVAKHLGISKATSSQVYFPLPVKTLKVAIPKASTGFSRHDTSSSLVKLVHGSFDGSNVEFLVNKRLLCKFSSVCSARLGQESTDGNPQTYKIDRLLPDSVFRTFLDWLQYQKIPDYLGELKDLKKVIEKIKRGSEGIQELVGLWLLADELDIASLQNAALVLLEELLVETGGYTLDLVEAVRHMLVGSSLGTFFTNRTDFYQLDDDAKATLLHQEEIAQDDKEYLVLFDPIKVLDYQITRKSLLIQNMQADLQMQVEHNRQLQVEFLERVAQRKLEISRLIRSLRSEMGDSKNVSPSRRNVNENSIAEDDPVVAGQDYAHKLIPIKTFFK